jgi:hypothetical protein
MQSVLSLVSGAVIVVLVYGLSFLPSATLAQVDEKEMSSADEDGISPDAEDACCRFESAARPPLAEDA